MGNEVSSYYQRLQRTAEARGRYLSKRITVIGTLRLLVFLGTCIAAWVLWGNGGAVIAAVVVGIVLFLLLVKIHERYFNMREIAYAQVDIAKDNLNRLALVLDECPTGAKYVDARHPYTNDLDIFGKDSLYSLLDTTCTPLGGALLADWLREPLSLKNELSKRQEAIEELKSMNDFRTQFRTYGLVHNTSKENGGVKEIADFRLALGVKFTAVIYPTVMIVAILLAVFSIIPISTVVYLFILGVVIAGLMAKTTSHRHRELEVAVASLTNMSDLIDLVETTEFQSPLLATLKHNFQSTTTSASMSSRKLGKILTNFDQRYNAISFLLLNGLALWDFHCLWSAERWFKKFGKEMGSWNVAMAQIDALAALGTFSYNNSNYIFPLLDSSGIEIMEAKGLGHPLMAATQCVRNDVAPMTDGTFQVITGANMAGKSTYLRTVGVNYLLALIGAPVCAEAMKFTPVAMLTGLRTTDSLHNNESYFFAELKRLQSIIQQAEAGERILVILDEILKGTNSTDKQKGSLALVSKLVTLRVAGIIATHDLLLGKLAQEFPTKVSNYRFEATIANDNLTFSYRIHPGVAQNMNACFLMEKMGII